MSAEVKEFGKLKDGTAVTLYTLTNAAGTEASFIDLGACWVTMKVKDRAGIVEDVLLGYDDPDTYYNNPTCTGECIGRSANRIGGGTFTLEGKTYQLEKNDNGRNNLHSGTKRWEKVLFEGSVEEAKLGSKVSFHYACPDGSQGFPGNLDFTVSYTLTEDDSVIIEYRGVSDQTTVINPTNHAYFNLRGHGAGEIGDHEVWINADYITAADPWSIPTGEVRPVAGTPMDFTMRKPIGQDINADYDQLKFAGGYDHNYVINGWNGKINLAAKVKDPVSGRKMKVYTDLPGVQFYTGNFLDAKKPAGKGCAVYGHQGGYCFETQFYPDSVNHPEWPQPVFRAGEEYHHFTIYKFVTRMDGEEEEED